MAACRYLEILSSQTRDLGDDLKEYFRRFESCADLVSQEHVDMAKLTTMFLKGLPPYWNSVRHSSRMFKRESSLQHTIEAAKNLIWENQLGVATVDDSMHVDRLLRTFQVRTHPKADLVENANFDRFLEFVTSSTHEQLLQTLFPNLPKPDMASDVETTNSSGYSSQTEPLIYTPSTSSPDPTPEAHTEDLPPEMVKEVAVTFGNHMIENMTTAARALRLGCRQLYIDSAHLSMDRDVTRLCEATHAYVRQRRADQEYSALL